MAAGRVLLSAIPFLAPFTVRADTQGWLARIGNIRIFDMAVTSDSRVAFTGSDGQNPPTCVIGKMATVEAAQFDWVYRFAPGGAGQCQASSIRPTGDGGLVVSGTAASGSNSGNVIFKLSNAGSVEWQKLMPGVGNFANVALPAADGGYFITGSYGSPRQWWTAKLDNSGNSVWQRRYTFLEGARDGKIVAARQSSDGGFVLAGTIQGFPVTVMKLDSTGSPVWHKNLSEHVQGEATDVVEAADGGYVVSASRGSALRLIKLRADGTFEWSRLYPSRAPTTLARAGSSVLVFGSFNTAPQYFCAKIDSASLPEWGLTIESSAWGAGSIDGLVLPDGNILMHTERSIARVDANGQLGRECPWVNSGNVNSIDDPIVATDLFSYAFATSVAAVNFDATASAFALQSEDVCPFNPNDPPDINVSPEALYFGASPGGSDQRTLTIYNTGIKPLNIREISIPPNPFSIVSDQCSASTLLELQACNIVVRYTPSSGGPHSTTLAILSNDPDEPSLVIPFRGTTVAPATPLFVSATGNGPSSVSVSWAAASGATAYEIQRASSSATYTPLVTTELTSYNDTAVSAGAAYAYRVRALAGSLTSPFGTPDIATTVAFADDPLVPATTIIKAIHVEQLRSAVNALRAAAGLTPLTFTDPVLTAGSTVVKAIHIEELRGGVNPARSALGVSSAAFADAPLVANSTIIRSVHLGQLRDALK